MQSRPRSNHRNHRPSIFLTWAVLVITWAGAAVAERLWFNDQNRFFLDTGLYTASTGKNAYCHPARRDGDLTISLRFKPGANIEAGQNPAYTKLVEEEIAPRIEQLCGEVQTLNILNFFAKNLINAEGKAVPASRASFSNLRIAEYPAFVRWVWFDAIYAGKFPPPNTPSYGDPTLTTWDAIFAWWERGADSSKAGAEERAAKAAAEAAEAAALARATGIYRGQEFWHGYREPEKLMEIFHGEFEGGADDPYFKVALIGYVAEFSDRCADYLPADHAKLQLTTTKYENGYVVEETAHPDLLSVDRRFKEYYLRYKRTAGTWHSASYLASVTQGKQPLIRQPEKLIGRLLEQMNCQGAEVEQLRENLLRIAAGRPLIRARPVASDDSHLMVTDPASSLTWTRRDSGFSSDWEGAFRYCLKLTLGGYRDWRLPTADELTSVFDREKYSRRELGYSCDPSRPGKPVIEKAPNGKIFHHANCFTRLGIKVSSYETWNREKWVFGFDRGERRGVYMREARALCVRDDEGR